MRGEQSVAKVGRNQPCPCGSGRKAKRCCGIASGPSEESLARAYLAHAAREAAADLAAVSDEDFDRLYDELLDLPELDLTLQVELPKLLSPELDRLCEAIADEDEDAMADAIDDALRVVDTQSQRAHLAVAVIALREAGRLDARLGAVALIDLASDHSRFLYSSLIEAAGVKAGAVRTPASILLAA